jgi:CRISPR-associated protein Cas1
MIKQTLMFTSPVYLSLKDGQLVITFKDNKDTVTRPIEDIGFVIIEHPEVSITIPVLNELADNNVSVVSVTRRKCQRQC